MNYESAALTAELQAHSSERHDSTLVPKNLGGIALGSGNEGHKRNARFQIVRARIL
jgi:hypothetical protein